MKLKFYLRGIGIGVFVTAIILHFSLAGKGSAPLTDEEIKQKAAALGMIESTVLKPVSDNTVNQDAEVLENQAANVVNDDKDILAIDNKEAEVDKEASDKEVSDKELSNNEDSAIDSDKDVTDEKLDDTLNGDLDNNTNDNESDGGAEVKDPSEVVADNQVQDTPKEEEKPVDATTANCIININAGDSSFVVAKRCAEAGLVNSAAEYDMYLCKNGYDKRLVVGVHNIEAGASEEEIAKNLTSATKK